VKARQWRVRTYLPEIVRGADTDFDIMVGGISRLTGPDSFLLCTHARYAEPWTVLDPGELMMSPMTPAIEQAVVSEFSRRSRSIDDLDPAADGLRMVEIQREHWPFGSDTLPGGFVQLMSLGANSAITTRIVHRWEMPPALKQSLERRSLFSKEGDVEL
jgi:hypothetical protein